MKALSKPLVNEGQAGFGQSGRRARMGNNKRGVSAYAMTRGAAIGEPGRWAGAPAARGAHLALVAHGCERPGSLRLSELPLPAGLREIHAACLDSVQELERFLAGSTPRLLLIGVELCERIGAAGLARLRSGSPATDWALAWAEPLPRWCELILQTHSRGGVAWGIEAAQWQQALGAMLAGELWLPRALMQALYTTLLDAPHAAAASDTPGAALTTREVEAMALLRQGLHNKEIAARLGVSVNTVKKHLSNAFEKRGLHSRRQMFR
jgi:DNA-binding NarL/FixJ family response regulator